MEKNLTAFLNLSFKSTLLSAGFSLAMVFSVFLPFGWGAEAPPLLKKEIPEFTFQNLFPPYKDYTYFQNWEAVPFEYDASFFNLGNAWWLAEASTLVYADEAYVTQRFRAAGFKRVTFFNRNGTQCFIASNSRFAIVAFRGSEIWKRNDRFDPRQMIADFTTNIDIRLSDWARGGKVHRGFKVALDGIWEEMLPEIKELENQGLKIWVTGHSLGAALATLAADRLQRVQGLYTFGSPRVGNKEFQKAFRPKAFRVVNGNDIVADIPPENPYGHVGVLKLIDPTEEIPERAAPAVESDGTSHPEASNVSESAKENQTFNSGLFIPSFIRDHVPLLYSIFIWNELVQKLKSDDAKQ